MRYLILIIFVGVNSYLTNGQKFAFVNKTAVILRDNPNGKKIMQLPYATKLDILNSDNSWHYIEISPKIAKGYIHESVISFDTLKKTQFDQKKVSVLELVEGGFEDSYVVREHTVETQFTPSVNKGLNEGFERMLYWNSPRPFSKHFIYNIDVMVERTKEGIYNNTPCEVFNQSKIYNLSAKVYNNEIITKPKPRKFEKPQIKNSFFSSEPENYLITSVKEQQNKLFISTPNLSSSRPVLLHLLKIYFKNENTFKLSKHNGEYTYSSTKRVSFFSTDEYGNNIVENTGVIIYFPGQNSRICISNLEKPYNSNMKYLYFSDEDMINKHLRTKISITTSAKTINGWEMFNVHEFDFDNDGIVDMMKSFENCPEEAGDSSDLVYYFNVNGEWKPKLVLRTWCNP